MNCATGTIQSILEFGVYAQESEADFLEACTSKAGLQTDLPECAYLSDPSSSLYNGSVRQKCFGKK